MHPIYGSLDELKVVQAQRDGDNRPAPQLWPDWLKTEYAVNRTNDRVGQTLVSEVRGRRVWHIALEPGDRLPLHRHTKDYFWTATSDGVGRSHDWDGVEAITEYKKGMTKHYRFEAGASYLHDLENVGETRLDFVVVEFLE